MWPGIWLLMQLIKLTSQNSYFSTDIITYLYLWVMCVYLPTQR